MGEALKLEGDKLTHLLRSLEMIGTKFENLKRVVVYTLHEGETLPSGIIQKEGHCYLVEYFPPLGGQRDAQEPQDKNPRDGKSRGGKRGGKRDGDNRAPRGPRQPQSAGPTPKASPVPLPKPLK